jgi:hypothetical protein
MIITPITLKGNLIDRFFDGLSIAHWGKARDRTQRDSVTAPCARKELLAWAVASSFDRYVLLDIVNTAI